MKWICPENLSQNAVSMNWRDNVSVMFGWVVLQHQWGFLKEEFGITQWSLCSPGLMNKCWSASLQTQPSLQLPSEKVIKYFVCLMSSVWLQTGPSERWIYDRWGQSCVYQNLVIPCNGEAVHCVACIILYVLCIHLFPSIYLPPLKRPFLSTFWGILFNLLSTAEKHQKRKTN